MDPDAPPSPKKPRIDDNQEKVLQQQQQHIIELLLKELQDCNRQHIVMINQRRLQNQLRQPILPSVPHLNGIHLQPPVRQMRNMLQGQGNRFSSLPLLDGDPCSQRFMQYLHHLRNRPVDNNIEFWKMFVSKYYAPDSKMRWCFSAYKDIEKHATVVFCPKAMETWCCDVCGSSSGKGLEATIETFPRLLKTKFDSGMLDEILFLDLPRVSKIASGLRILKYMKAVQQSIYDKFRVVHEGKLHIIFSQDLKILSLEFCVEKQEDFLLRTLVAPQVDELASAAKKFQNDNHNGISFKASSENMRTIYNAYFSAEQKLANSMDSSLVNGLGHPKRFTRSLQIVEIVNSMKDLMAFSLKRKMGPIESLKKYSRCCKTIHQMELQGNELIASPQNLLMFPENCIGRERKIFMRSACSMRKEVLDSRSVNSYSYFDPPFSNHNPYANASPVHMRRFQPSELGRHAR